MQANNGNSSNENNANNNANNIKFELSEQFMAFRMQQQNQQQTEDWINQVPNDQIDPNDSISLTSLKTDNQDFNSDITDLKKFFGIEGNFLNKRELVLSILTNRSIDWCEKSKDPNITELVLDTFATKIHWLEVLFGLRIDPNTAKQYSKYFIKCFNTERFWEKYDGEPLVTQIAMEIMNESFNSKVFELCIQKDFYDSFEVLIHTNNYSKDISQYEKSPNCLQVLLDNGYVIPTSNDLQKAVNKNHYQIVEVLLKDGRIQPTIEHLQSAINDDYYQIVELLLKDDRVQPTIEHLQSAIKKNHYQIVELLLKDGRVQPTDGHLQSAINDDYYQIVELLLNNDYIITTNNDLQKAIDKNHYKIVEVLLKDRRIQLTNDHLQSAIYNNSNQIVELLLKDGRVQPTNDHLQIAIERNHYQIVELLLKDGRVHPTDEYLQNAYNNNNHRIINLLFKDGRVQFTSKDISNIINGDFHFHCMRNYNNIYICYCSSINELLLQNNNLNLRQIILYNDNCKSTEMQQIINKYR
jgi:ribosome maturation protein Sdo1